MVRLAQLAFTSTFISIACTQEQLAVLMIDSNPHLVFVLLVLLFYAFPLLMFRCKSMRKSPYSFIILVLFIVLETYLLAMIWVTVYFNRETNSFEDEGYIWMGLIGGMRVGILAGPTAHAWTAKTDFKAEHCVLWVSGIAILMYILVGIIFGDFTGEYELSALGIFLGGSLLTLEMRGTLE